MVGFKGLAWLPETAHRRFTQRKERSQDMIGFMGLAWLPETYHRRLTQRKERPNLGILAFETATIMSKLVSLYKSLSDLEISRLKKDVVRSKGVQFLTSGDDEFLLSLARAEILEDLDRAASAVAYLGRRCEDYSLNQFAVVYTDLKLGTVSLGKSGLYGSRAAETKVSKMEKLAALTVELYAALNATNDLEISERKLKLVDMDDISQKLEKQRKKVRYLRETSLWSQPFDETINLMARTVIVAYLRICDVFGPHQNHLRQNIVPNSGPLLTKSKPLIVRFHSQRSIHFSDGDESDDKAHRPEGVFRSAEPETVGGSGLTSVYSNLILLAEKYLGSENPISNEDRQALYSMLPENLRSALRTKLCKKNMCTENDELLAEGWREAMEEILGWLGPVARDSVRWVMERNVLERMKFDGCGKTRSVLLLQTLHFADREKTEAAIAELLVGLSCIFRFENRQVVL